MVTYSFDTDIAKKYGVEEAIMIQNFQYWIEKNRANGKNYRDGRTWTYNSARAFVELYDFWSIDKIKRILKSLKDQGVLITECYNENAYDRTLWYAFSNESMWLKPLVHSAELHNGESESAPPIPDIKPDIKPDINTHTIARENKSCYFQKIHEAWMMIKDVPKPLAYANWAGTYDFQKICEYIKGIHSKNVLAAIDRYRQILDGDVPGSWVTYKMTIGQFFKSDLFGMLQDDKWREYVTTKKDDGLTIEYIMSLKKDV